ncbi:MAG: 2-C-methyl-D-erythritol 4-phosphate cytidylyltransferase, partial [Campylobacterota bacterium]|nr:2-C-methyl-D-erythritol 4-phosphate cytidylyltransferase [Campylobacterota bacterium]
MIETTLVVLCAGNSTRFSLEAKKQWLRIEDEPLWLNVTKRLSSYTDFDKVIVVGHIDELNYMKNFTQEYDFVAGGSTRQESMKNALQTVTTKSVMVTDVARCCIPKSIILNLIENRSKATVIVPCLSATDTIVYENETINRDNVKIIQTPQLSNTKALKEALETNIEFTDDSSAIKSSGGTVLYIDGSTQSKKLT